MYFTVDLYFRMSINDYNKLTVKQISLYAFFIISKLINKNKLFNSVTKGMATICKVHKRMVCGLTVDTIKLARPCCCVFIMIVPN